MENETTLVSCPICLGNLRKPVTTPCGHNFCLDCLTQALARTPNRCPLHFEPEFPEGYEVAVNHQLETCIEWVAQNSSAVEKNAKEFGTATTHDSSRSTSSSSSLSFHSQPSTAPTAPTTAKTASAKAQKQRLLGKLGSVASGVCVQIREELGQLSSSSKGKSAPMLDANQHPQHRGDSEIALYFQKLHDTLHKREEELHRESDVELSRRVLALQRQQNSALELVQRVVDVQNRLDEASDVGDIHSLCVEADTIIQTAELVSQPVCHSKPHVELPMSLLEQCNTVGMVDTSRADPVYFCLVNSRFVFDADLNLPGCGHTELLDISKDCRTVKKVRDKAKHSTIVGRSIRPQNRTMTELKVVFTIDSISAYDDRDKVGLQTPTAKASSDGVVVKLHDGSVHVGHKRKGHVGKGQVRASEKITFSMHLLTGTVDIKRGKDTLTVDWNTQQLVHPVVKLKNVGWKLTMT
eukprot:m.26245 g.26245  ORF g.26245 m.26245 type:complete len:466 (+) comp9252_c0_seq2:157-1554(+)